MLAGRDFLFRNTKYLLILQEEFKSFSKMLNFSCCRNIASHMNFSLCVNLVKFDMNVVVNKK